MRSIIFATGEFYHIFNRGVDRRKIFLRQGHYARFVATTKRLMKTGSATAGKLRLGKQTPLKKKLDIICYCLMPNHYHFLVRQTKESGLTEFMHKLDTSYTKYFNVVGKRTGRLFEYTFKAIRVENDEQLLHLSRYIHLNPLIGNITTDLRGYSWSSYPDYVGLVENGFCLKDEIFGFYPKKRALKDYIRFVLDQVGYARRLHEIQALTFEK